MPKPDPALLDPSRYLFRCEIDPRYSDVDTNWHINNVASVDILQEGRVRFHSTSRYQRVSSGAGSLAVSLSVEYLGEAFHSAPLDMHVAVLAVGRTSHTLAQFVAQEGRPVAYAQTVLIFTKGGEPMENSAQFREEIAQWMLKP